MITRRKKSRSLTPIEIVLSPRHSSGEAWRKLRAAIAALTDADLETAAEFERLSRRRPEVLQALRAERRRRQGVRGPTVMNL